MSDPISRSDAIGAKPEYRNEDMLDKEKSTYNKGWNDCNDAWVAIIKAVPSAELVLQTPQTYGKSINSSNAEAVADYISRADAIETVKDTILKRFNLADWYEEMLNCGVEIEDRINALPSADAEYADLPDIPRYYYEKVVGNMAHEINMLKEQLESADAVQGEWVRKYDDKVNCYWYECDQCGEYRPRNQFGHEYNANFCPNCGAKMHKGGDDK